MSTLIGSLCWNMQKRLVFGKERNEVTDSMFDVSSVGRA